MWHMVEQHHFAGLKLVSSILQAPYPQHTEIPLFSLACSPSGAKATRGKVIEKTNQEERYPTHLKWGLLEGRKEKLDMGEGRASICPQCKPVSALLQPISPLFSLPPSILHAAANIWMLGWLGETLSEIYFCQTILHSFFGPADNSVSSRLLWEPVNLEVTHLTETLLFKHQTKKKVDSGCQGDLKPNLIHYLGV